MTKKSNGSVIWTADDNNKLVDTYQEILMRQAQAAYDAGEMEPDVYDSFVGGFCTEFGREEVYDYYQLEFNRLIEYHQMRLQDRIVRGAELLESMDKSDPNFERYMKHYDSLIECMNKSWE